MRKSLALLVIGACLPLLAADSRPVPPSIEVLAAYPRMSSFDVSPDGKHLVALEARGEERVILVWKTDALSSPPTVIGTKNMKFNRVQFIKDDTLAVNLWQPFDLRFDPTTPSRWLDIDAIEEVVERALVDRACNIALDRRCRNFERPRIETVSAARTTA